MPTGSRGMPSGRVSGRQKEASSTRDRKPRGARRAADPLSEFQVEGELISPLAALPNLQHRQQAALLPPPPSSRPLAHSSSDSSLALGLPYSTPAV